jgi:hypothetical protein
MPQAVDSIAIALEELNQRIRDLERRMAALEDVDHAAVSQIAAHQDSALSPLKKVAGSGAPATAPTQRPASWAGFPLEIPNGAVSVLGRAILGIAGAYLLRAVAESASIPRLPVLVLAIFYAAFWMAWAAHIHAQNRFASATYALTSALIVSPLLWEATVRFQTLPPAWTAFVLCAYVLLAIALARRDHLQLIPWIATVASVAIALALIIETHELVIFASALLGIAAICETAGCLGQRLTLRAVPAVAADFSVWLVISILASDESIPEAYHAAKISTITLLCLLLPAISAGSIAVRNFVLGKRLSVFEITQSMLAFTLGSYGAVRATQGRIGLGLGVLFLVMGAASYWGALWRFTQVDQKRNRRVCANWAAALCLAAVLLLFSAAVQIAVLCVGAVAAAFVYTRTGKVSLGIHASVYLAAASAISPLPKYVAGALAGNIPGAPDWHILVPALTAALCYGIGSRAIEQNPKRRLLWVVPAALTAFTVAAALVAAVVSFTRGELAASTLSVVRTVVNCFLAIALGFLASRGKRLELRWVAYAAVVFGTIKLLLEDLRFGNAASLVVSLLFYGTVLILLPRFNRTPEGGTP